MTDTVERETGFHNPKKRPEFARHYYQNYSSPRLPPSWMITEVLSLGTWSKLYARLKCRTDKKAVANRLQIPRVELASDWMFQLTFLRNICAHHALLWNRRFQNSRYSVSLDGGVSVRTTNLFGMAALVQKCLKVIAPDSRWARRLHQFLTCSEAPLGEMGFRVNWETDSFWR